MSQPNMRTSYPEYPTEVYVHTDDQILEMIEDRLRAIEDYARAKPWTFGLWMAGIGFVLGWKLKPW